MAKILKNGTVLSLDETTGRVKVLPKASILITDGRVDTINSDISALSAPADAEIIDVEGKIVSPGFVNTHVHMWQTAYKTLGPDIFVVQYFMWLSQMSPATKAWRADDIYISTLEGYLDGLNGGVTSFVDHAHNNWAKDVMKAGYDAAIDGGARVWWCYDVNHRDNFSIDEQWDEYRKIAVNHNKSSSTVVLGASLDGTARLEDAVFEKSMRMVRELGIEALTTHHIGGLWPVGDNSPTYLVDRGVDKAKMPVVYSHAGYLSDEEMRSLREHDHYISITPESEFHHGHGQKTGGLISDHASLGCDGNWTYSGDILGQARLWLQTVRHTTYLRTLDDGKLPNQNPMKVEDAFLLATRQGGRALWRDDIGVLKPGAKADIVVWNAESPNMLGWKDPIAAVMLHANIGDVEHVFVDGQWRKKDFKLVSAGTSRHGLSWEEVKNKYLEMAKRIQRDVGNAPEAPKEWFGKMLGDVQTSSTEAQY